jgi:hypothetical protein
MAVGILGAFGFGLAAGAASRIVEQGPIRRPADEVRHSSRLLGAALTLLLSRSMHTAVQRVASFGGTRLRRFIARD